MSELEIPDSVIRRPKSIQETIFEESLKTEVLSNNTQYLLEQAQKIGYLTNWPLSFVTRNEEKLLASTISIPRKSLLKQAEEYTKEELRDPEMIWKQQTQTEITSTKKLNKGKIETKINPLSLRWLSNSVALATAVAVLTKDTITALGLGEQLTSIVTNGTLSITVIVKISFFIQNAIEEYKNGGSTVGVLSRLMANSTIQYFLNPYALLPLLTAAVGPGWVAATAAFAISQVTTDIAVKVANNWSIYFFDIEDLKTSILTSAL